jgi:hypothetical protein
MKYFSAPKIRVQGKGIDVELRVENKQDEKIIAMAFALARKRELSTASKRGLPCPLCNGEGE